MNKKILLKKTIILLLIVSMLLSFIIPKKIYAKAGSGTWKISEQYNSSIKTTDYHLEYGIFMRNITNVNTGEVVTAFCAEHRS